MATVHRPSSHPYKSSMHNAHPAQTASSVEPPQSLSSASHTFYGYEYISRLCARFITHLFDCPEYPPSSVSSPQVKLPYFIAYAFHRTKLHESVTFSALVLLQRLKARFPTARGSSGHRLFISAFMLASKVVCDDTYSNKSWSIVAQQMFSLREINQMEREMCNYLDWELSVDGETLKCFERRVKEDFAKDAVPFPNYPLQMVSKRAAKAAASKSNTPMPEPHPTTAHIPSFGQRNPSPTKSTTASPSAVSHTACSYPIPDTPSPSHSTTTSPASSASPQTPVGHEDFSADIREYDSPIGFRITDKMVPNWHSNPLKNEMFARALPAVW